MQSIDEMRTEQAALFAVPHLLKGSDYYARSASVEQQCRQCLGMRGICRPDFNQDETEGHEDQHEEHAL